MPVRMALQRCTSAASVLRACKPPAAPFAAGCHGPSVSDVPGADAWIRSLLASGAGHCEVLAAAKASPNWSGDLRLQCRAAFSCHQAIASRRSESSTCLCSMHGGLSAVVRLGRRGWKRMRGESSEISWKPNTCRGGGSCSAGRRRRSCAVTAGRRSVPRPAAPGCCW